MYKKASAVTCSSTQPVTHNAATCSVDSARSPVDHVGNQRILKKLQTLKNNKNKKENTHQSTV
jgi:hypothetical protein